MRGERLEQAGRLHQRRLEGAGDLGEQHLARRQVGERLDLGRREDPRAEQAALHDERRVVLGELAQRLRRRGGVALHERDGDRALEQRRDVVEPGASTPRRASVFLNTLYSVPDGRSAPRSSASSWTVRPRYSVSTVASASASLVRISSTTATFSGLAMCRLSRNERNGTPQTADVPSSPGGPASMPAGARLVRRAGEPITSPGDRTETGGLRQIEVVSGAGYYAVGGDAAPRRGVTAGSIFTPGPMVDDVLTALR